MCRLRHFFGLFCDVRGREEPACGDKCLKLLQYRKRGQLKKKSTAFRGIVRSITLVLLIGMVFVIGIPNVMAQTSPKGSMQEEMMHQQTMMTDGTNKVVQGGNMISEAMKMVEEKKDVAGRQAKDG